MTPVRQGAPGATRICPHCRQTILESASVCPACRHHLRFVGGGEKERERAPSTFCPLLVEGTIRHPADGDAWEYSIVVSVLDEAGSEISRHVAGVGVIRPFGQRSFTLGVEVFASHD